MSRYFAAGSVAMHTALRTLHVGSSGLKQAWAGAAVMIEAVPASRLDASSKRIPLARIM